MVFEKIKKILAEQLDVDAEEMTVDTKIADDLGADSLDVVELLMSIEDEFEVEIPDEEIENLKTIGDGAFYECINLTDIKLPNPLECIEKSAFFRCQSLEHLAIPDFYQLPILLKIAEPETKEIIFQFKFHSLRTLLGFDRPFLSDEQIVFFQYP